MMASFSLWSSVLLRRQKRKSGKLYGEVEGEAMNELLCKNQLT